MSDVEVPFISYEEIRIITEEILRRLNPNLELPIPIDRIVEFEYSFKIRGIPGLLRETGSPGMLSKDQSIIFVDDDVINSKVDHYYRSTLAHELGHKLLHGKIFASMDFGTFEEMKRFYDEFPEDKRKFLERQANDFAGLLLVPTASLRQAFAEAENMIPEQIRGRDNEDTTLSYLRDFISRRFQVSPEHVIRIRLKQEGLRL